MVMLPAIATRDLPPLAYAHTADHNQALTAPSSFRPVVTRPDFGVKPSGGLWTAPVTEQHPDGTPSWTEWIEWCNSEGWGADGYTHLTEIQPAPDARVLRIDSLPDLVAIVNAYPSVNEKYAHLAPSMQWRFPDWAALAADGWDAVYLTEDGQWATRIPPSDQPNLYTWDVATVLWLRPAYTVGRTVQAARPVCGDSFNEAVCRLPKGHAGPHLSPDRPIEPATAPATAYVWGDDDRIGHTVPYTRRAEGRAA